MRPVKILAVLFVLVAGTLGGALWYAKRLPEVVTYRKSIHLGIPQSDIWARLTDMQTYPSWRPSMRAVMPKSEDSISLTEWNEVYSRAVLKSRRVSLLIPDSLVLEFIPEERNFYTRWTWVLEPLPPDSTIVTLMSQNTLASPLFRLSQHFFGGSDEAADQVLKDLANAKAR